MDARLKSEMNSVAIDNSFTMGGGRADSCRTVRSSSTGEISIAMVRRRETKPVLLFQIDREQVTTCLDSLYPHIPPTLS